MTPFLLLGELEKILSEATKDISQSCDRKIKVYQKNAPMRRTDDDDEKIFPYCLVRLGDGSSGSIDAIQEVTLIFAAFDESENLSGFDDVANMIEAVRQHFYKYPDFGAYSVLDEMKWIYPEDDETYPYFFGAILLKIAVPRMQRVSNYI